AGYAVLPPGAILQAPGQPYPGYLIAAPFDNEGGDDLAVSYFNQTDGRWHLAFHRPSDAQGYVLDIAQPPGSSAGGGLAAGDFNNDGALDLLISGWGQTGVGTNTIIYAVGDIFSGFFWTVPGTTSVGYAAALGDLNGDGHLDAVTGAAPDLLGG